MSGAGVWTSDVRRTAAVRTHATRRSWVAVLPGTSAGPVTGVPGVGCRNGHRPATVQPTRRSRVHNLPRTAVGAVMRFPGAAGRNRYLPATVRTAAPAPGRGTSGSVPGTPPRPVEP